MGLHFWYILPDIRLQYEAFKSGENAFPAWTGMTQLVGRQSTKERVTGLTPGQGLGFSPW